MVLRRLTARKAKVAGKALQLGLGRSSGFHRGLPRRGDSGILKLPGPRAARDSRRREVAAQHPPACRRNQRAVYGARPSKLTEFQTTRYRDPVSGKPLEYSAKPPAGYTTCTIFDTGSPKEDADDAFAFWTHNAGHKCYDFEAGQVVPQVPYNYYY